jgi:hypothetical protein
VNAGVNEQIVELICEYEDLIAAAQRLVARLNDASFVRPPDAHRWSPAECIAHLTITNDAYLPHIRASVAAGKLLPPATKKYRRDVAGFLLSRRLEPTPSSARKTPAHSDAIHLKPRMETLAAYIKSQRELQYLAWDSAGLDLERLKIASPFNPSVRYNLYSAYRVLGALGRRHIAQAEASAG